MIPLKLKMRAYSDRIGQLYIIYARDLSSPYFFSDFSRGKITFFTGGGGGGGGVTLLMETFHLKTLNFDTTGY